MKLFDEIEIEWSGKSVAIKPSFELLNQIEAHQGLSLMNLALRSFKQDMPLTLACQLYSRLLQIAGIAVSPEEVYTSLEAGTIIGAANSLLNSCMPEQKGSGKPAKESDEKKP